MTTTIKIAVAAVTGIVAGAAVFLLLGAFAEPSPRVQETINRNINSLFRGTKRDPS